MMELFQKTSELVKKLSSKDNLQFDMEARLTQSSSVSFKDSKLHKTTSSEMSHLNLRILNNKTSSCSYTKDFSEEGIKNCYAQARQSLQLSDITEQAFLSQDQNFPSLSIHNPAMQEVSLKEKIQFAKSIDQALQDKGAKAVANVIQQADTSTFFSSSFQKEASYKSNSLYAYSYALCVEGSKRGQGISQKGSRSFDDIDFYSLGEKSASLAQKKLNAIIPKTGRYAVCFQSGQASSTLLSFLVEHLNASKIKDKLSLLDKSLNKNLFSPQLSVEDNPWAVDGFYSQPFDGEAYSSKPTPLIHKGQVKNYLTTSSLAKKLQCPATAKAARADKGHLEPRFTNVVMQAGESSFEDMLKTNSEVLVIDYLKGLAGYSPVSGKLSIESEGFLYKKGEPQACVQFAVSASLLDIFSRIAQVSKDRSWYGGRFYTPSFLVEDISIAGL